MVLLLPEMLTRTTKPVLRRSSSLKGWHTASENHTQQQHNTNITRMPSPNPNTRMISSIPHVKSLPIIPYSSSPIKHSVKIPVQSPPSHSTHRTTTPHPHPRPTLRPSRRSSTSSIPSSSSSIPSITSPVATPTRPPLLRRVVTPTRPSILRRTAAHLDNTTFERVTRRRLLSPTPVNHTTTSSPSTTVPAPPPSPITPKRRRIPRRFTFAPIHVLTSQLRDVNVTEMEKDILQNENEYEQENNITPANDLITWWQEQESPVWKPPPILHTLIEDDWEDKDQQHHHILPHTQTSCTESILPSTTTSTTSLRTPLRPPPILLPHTIESAPPYRYMPITPRRSPDLQLHSPPICQDSDIAIAMLSPTFAQLSMDVDIMSQLPKDWQPQDISQYTPSPITTTTTTTTSSTPRTIDDITHEIGQWMNMDTQ